MDAKYRFPTALMTPGHKLSNGLKVALLARSLFVSVSKHPLLSVVVPTIYYYSPCDYH